jgi:beta-glucuronidase
MIDPLDHGLRDRWFRCGHPDREWYRVRVPSAWDVYRPELNGYEGVGWYRRVVNVSRGDISSPLALRFEGVNYACVVWVNGVAVGGHAGGHTAFELDIVRAVRPGRNVVAVRVENIPSQDRVPQAKVGWWHYGGILRDVTLLVRSSVYLADAALDATADENGRGGLLRVRLELVNAGRQPVGVDVSADVGGRWKTRQEIVIGVRATRSGRATLKLELACRGARLWSPRSPALHDLRIRIRDVKGRLLDERGCRVGFRTVTVDDRRLLLNGRPLRLCGVNYHEQYAGSGPCGTETQVRQDLNLIKRLGANFIRAAHYPHQPCFYKLCDELGLLVMDEIPLWQVAVPGTRVTVANIRALRAAARQQVREMIAQNRHHACVGIWSVGNENSPFRRDVAKLISGLLREARRLDATRPVTYVTAPWNNAPPWYSDEPPLAEADIICLNEYFGFMHGEAWKPGEKYKALRPEEIATKALPRLKQGLEWAERRFPDKPILITELGEEGLRGAAGIAKGSERFQAECLRQHLRLLLARERVAGVAVWCFADYLVHRRAAQPMPGIGFFTFPLGLTGLVDFDRQPKAAYAAVRKLFRSAAAR